MEYSIEYIIINFIDLQDSDDVRYMLDALKKLGVKYKINWMKNEIIVNGCNGKFPTKGCELFLGNAGTAMRPLTAAIAAAGKGHFILDGVSRMRERPIQDLVDGLKQLGADIKCTLGTGCPPVEINANGLVPGKVKLSQFFMIIIHII